VSGPADYPRDVRIAAQRLAAALEHAPGDTREQHEAHIAEWSQRERRSFAPEPADAEAMGPRSSFDRLSEGAGPEPVDVPPAVRAAADRIAAALARDPGDTREQRAEKLDALCAAASPQVDPERDHVAASLLHLRRIVAERGGTHGSLAENFDLIARLWSVYLGAPVEPDDAACMMVLFKIARRRSGDRLHRDHTDDAAVYALIADALARRNHVKEA
jgi:hypothetical protein